MPNCPNCGKPLYKTKYQDGDTVFYACDNHEDRLLFPVQNDKIVKNDV